MSLMSRKELTIEQKQEVKETYKILTEKYDDKLLRIEDLKTAMMGLGLSVSNDEINRIIEEQTIFKRIRKNEKVGKLEKIDFDDFVTIVHYRLVNKRYTFENDCNKIFNLMSAGKENLSKKDLQLLAEKFDDKYSCFDTDKLYESVDLDRDKLISQKDFKGAMNHVNY